MYSKLIETERLLLRGLSPEDIGRIFGSLSKPEIMEVLGHRTDADYLKEEYKYRNGYATYNRTFLVFLLVDR